MAKKSNGGNGDLQLIAPNAKTTHPGRTIYGAFTGVSASFSQLTYSLVGEVPSNVVLLSSSAGVVMFKPTWEQAGLKNPKGYYSADYVIRLQVTDAAGQTDEKGWTVTVSDAGPTIDDFEETFEIPPHIPGVFTSLG